MTSFFTGLRAGVAVASITGVLAMAGCPGGDDSSSDTTQSMTTMTGDTGADTGMQETGTPTDESGDTGSAPAYADIQAIWDEHCTERRDRFGRVTFEDSTVARLGLDPDEPLVEAYIVAE